MGSSSRVSRPTCKLMCQNCSISSPIGNITITACRDGLHQLYLDPEVTDDSFFPDLSRAIKYISNKDKDSSYQTVQDTILWLKLYFKDPILTKETKKPIICSSLKNSNTFQSRVLQQLLLNVKCGNTITYKELASLTGSPGAMRAVGTAMKNNPICIIVPCHRVVRTDGAIGFYGGGKKQKLKRWLLEHERSTV